MQGSTNLLVFACPVRQEFEFLLAQQQEPLVQLFCCKLTLMRLYIFDYLVKKLHAHWETSFFKLLARQRDVHLSRVAHVFAPQRRFIFSCIVQISGVC